MDSHSTRALGVVSFKGTEAYAVPAATDEFPLVSLPLSGSLKADKKRTFSRRTASKGPSSSQVTGNLSHLRLSHTSCQCTDMEGRVTEPHVRPEHLI